jgi:cytochrome c oxidase cbb3-type subunit 2
VVVAKPEALDLVAYLLALDRTYTVLSAEEAEWAANRLAPNRLAKQPAGATDTNESGKTDETQTNP